MTEERLLEIAVAAAVRVAQGNPLPPVGVDEHLGTAEIARYAHVSDETVRRWIGKGLPARKIEGRWFIRWGDFLEWQDCDVDAAVIEDALRRAG